MSDTNPANVTDGVGNLVKCDENGLLLQAAPGENINLITSEGGEVIANGTPVGGGGVTSFNGRTGAVLPESGDYDAADITGLDAAIEANSPVQVAKIVITAADLNAIGSTPIQLVAAPASGSILVPLSVTFALVAGGTAFAPGSQVLSVFPDSGSAAEPWFKSGDLTGFIDQSTDQVQQGVEADEVTLGVATGALMLGTVASGNILDGNGTLNVFVTYAVVVNP
jgi:hypothetical protein